MKNGVAPLSGARTSRTLRLCLVAAFVAAAAGAVLIGQGTSVLDPNAGLRELTAEVRQLRLAVEESTRTQSQTQALGVYLTVEQGRILQLANRLEATRKELEGADAEVRRLTADQASVAAMLSRETDPDRRRQMELQYRATKQELDGTGFRLQQIRNREGETSQALQVEEARWSDLISKLEQVIKK